MWEKVRDLEVSRKNRRIVIMYNSLSYLIFWKLRMGMEGRERKGGWFKEKNEKRKELKDKIRKGGWVVG